MNLTTPTISYDPIPIHRASKPRLLDFWWGGFSIFGCRLSGVFDSSDLEAPWKPNRNTRLGPLFAVGA